jgi:hypothetical protein
MKALFGLYEAGARRRRYEGGMKKALEAGAMKAA